VTIADCEYGDRVTGCGTDVKTERDCQKANNARDCCMTCARFVTPGVTTVPPSGKYFAEVSIALMWKYAKNQFHYILSHRHQPI
jgi:hypothetical protein